MHDTQSRTSLVVAGFDLGECGPGGAGLRGPPEKHRHESIGYVTPENEHYGRGEAIRAARRTGLAKAYATRIATRRQVSRDHT